MKLEKYQKILILIMIFAILIRVIFIYKTNISDYQFDVGISKYREQFNYEELYTKFDEGINEGRHINYIMNLYTYNALPNKIIGQFYHPPLHHFIMATYLKIADFIFDSAVIKLEGMQVITLIYSVIMLVSLYKILEELEVENKYKIISILMFSFYPLYVFLAGSINNDQLVTMFSILSLLYLIKWNKEPDIKNTILISLFIGLGAMTKTSIFVMLFPAMYVFFKKLTQFINEDKKIGKLLLELVIFSVITGWLSLWFQITSLMKGLNTLGIIEPYDYLNIEKYGIVARFGVTNILKISRINIWNYLIYSSLNFGLMIENNIIFKIMVLGVLTLVVDSIYFIIKEFKKEKILTLTLIIWWIFYFYLNIQMPFSCSMHSRYMLVPISIAFMFISKGMQNEQNKFLKIQVWISTIIVSLMGIVVMLFII